ncbi:MAG TPA: hypothetical protein DHW80_11090 [Acinetobacter sp.]|uniref:hypothetical protein n=1 Tax=Acinetobacter variabilis TaxID=70346 RepID=UPI000EDF11C5|nr:hypothetical protein [Acinetobacter variabilis]HCL60300.1 hypothetical protein [Acinetobacter sp.]
MSLVLKSNVVCTAANLTNVALLTMTPQEYYDQFSARVVADGGMIINPTELKSTIDFLFEKKLLGKLSALIGAKYAVKHTGGIISKVYSIDGVDFTPKLFGSGQAPSLNTADPLKPYIDMKNTGESFNNVTLLKSTKKVIQSRALKIGVSAVMQNTAKMTGVIAQSLDSDNIGESMPLWRVGSGAVGSTNMRFGVATEPYTPTATQDNLAYNTYTTVNSSEPIHFIADASKVSITTYKNGAAGVPFLRPLARATAELAKPITIGGYETSLSKGSSVSNFHEIWIFNNVTESEILLVDDFLRSKYI